MKCIKVNALFELVALIQNDIAAEQLELESYGKPVSMCTRLKGLVELILNIPQCRRADRLSSSTSHPTPSRNTSQTRDTP